MRMRRYNLLVIRMLKHILAVINTSFFKINNEATGTCEIIIKVTNL